MKKLVVAVLSLYILSTELSAYCYYVPCAPSVEASTAMVSQQYEVKFKEMQNELSKIEQSYKEYYEAEKQMNTKLKQYEALKKEYLLLIQEIAFVKAQEVNVLRQAHAVK